MITRRELDVQLKKKNMEMDELLDSIGMEKAELESEFSTTGLCSRTFELIARELGLPLYEYAPEQKMIPKVGENNFSFMGTIMNSLMRYH